MTEAAAFTPCKRYECPTFNETQQVAGNAPDTTRIICGSLSMVFSEVECPLEADIEARVTKLRIAMGGEL